MKKKTTKTIKRIHSSSKASKLRGYDPKSKLAMFVGIVLFITFSLLFVARQYNKGPFATLVAKTIGVNQIEVDVDDGSIQPETPSINITTEAYEAMQNATTREEKEEAKTLLRADLKEASEIRRKNAKEDKQNEIDTNASNLPAVTVVDPNAKTCTGANNTSFKSGDTVVGPVIDGKNSIYTCTDGSWSQKTDCGVTQKELCTQEQNPEQITIKPTYQIINEALKNGNEPQFNCNKNGAIYATGSYLEEDKLICKSGKWVEDTEYFKALELACIDSGKEWKDQKCNEKQVAAKCSFVKKCSGTTYQECLTKSDGRLVIKTSACPSNKCNEEGTDCAPMSVNDKWTCSGQDLTFYNATEKKSYVKKVCNTNEVCDAEKKDCAPSVASQKYYRTPTCENKCVGFCKKFTSPTGSGYSCDYAAQDLAKQICQRSQTLVFNELTGTCDPVDSEDKSNPLVVDNPANKIRPAGYKDNPTGKLQAGEKTDNINNCRWGGHLVGYGGQSRLPSYECYAEGETVTLTNKVSVGKDNSDYTTLNIGDNCGSFGYPSCNKCKGGISTKYQEVNGPSSTYTFNKCGSQEEITKLIGSESSTKIIGDTSVNQTLTVGTVCKEGALSSVKCTGCPKGVATDVLVDGKTIQVCGSPEEIEKLNLNNITLSMKPGNSVAGNTAIGAGAGCLAGAATYGAIGLMVGVAAAGIGTVVTTPAGLIGGCIAGALGIGVVTSAATATPSTVNIQSLKATGDSCESKFLWGIAGKEAKNGDESCASGTCEYDYNKSGWYCK